MTFAVKNRVHGRIEMNPQGNDAQSGLSLDAIARDYGNMVSSICRRMIMDGDTARDAAQQVWVEIVKSFPSFRGESKISTWIYTITRRIAADFSVNERTYSIRFVRDYFNGGDIDPPADVDLDRAIWVKQTCDHCVTAMLHCVDNESRLAHIFRDIAELDYAEIAGILEKDEAAVRQMVRRSRKRINSFLSDRCTLYNPRGDCRCRIGKHVKNVNLAAEYEKIGAMVRRLNFYRKSEMVFPGKNYWEGLL
jgi:RNA polymerase sigma-70 factor (ECF subfamily)